MPRYQQASAYDIITGGDPSPRPPRQQQQQQEQQQHKEEYIREDDKSVQGEDTYLFISHFIYLSSSLDLISKLELFMN